MLTEKKSRQLAALCGAAVGIMLGVTMLPLDFVVGTDGFWQQPKYDFYAYLTAWSYFIQDKWRIPLLDVPAMGYPEGGNLIYSDALPIAQLASKVFHSAVGVSVNPFGWWVLLTYVLQGAMAARVVRAAGVRSFAGWMAGAVLATASVPFMTRVFHVALSSHFLLLWALALYLESRGDRRFSPGEHVVLSALTLLVNAYLFVMVSAIQAVTVLALYRRGKLTARNLGILATGMLGVIAVGGLIGYGRMLMNPGGMRASGFGTFSWNPATLILPPAGHWDYIESVSRMAAIEQAEGESYIGLGGLLVIAACLLARPRQAAEAIRRHALFVSILVLFGLYALSNRVTLGPRLVVDLPLPSLLVQLGGFFRGSGRFIWPALYALTLFSVGGLLKWCPRRVAMTVLIIAVALQLVEARSIVRRYRPVLASPSEDLLDVARVGGWIAHHQRLFQFPSLGCQPPRTVEGTFRELQIQLLAARINVPNNSIYTARQLKDCANEVAWALEAGPDQETLYVLQKSTDVTHAAARAKLTKSFRCLDTGWGLVCSNHGLAQ